MASDWQTYSLGDAGRIVTGKTPPSSVLGMFGEDIPFVTPTDMDGSKWVQKTARALSKAGAESIRKSVIPAKSVLVSCIGSDMGKAALTSATCATNQQINAIVVDTSKFSSEFLFYNLSQRKAEIRGMAGGSAQPILNKSHFSDIAFDAPPITQQIELVAPLTALDDKIALLRETNATLEGIAQALFKSWFVDFDPVRAKAEGRDPEGVPPEVADLFPSEFEDSELGAIPKGWRWATLEALSELNPESWTNKVHPNSILYVDLANTKDNRIGSVTEYLFESAPSRARRVLREGDSIVGTVRPGNRSFAFIQEPPAGLTGSTGFAVLRPIKESAQEFIFLAATRTESIETLAHLADGGAYPAIRPELVQRLLVVIPCDSILDAFHKSVSPLLRQVAANEREATTLADARDTLLPRLMSGKLQVNEGVV